MRIIVAKDKEAAADLAAARLRDCLGQKSDAVLGLATGSTFLDFYRAVIKMRLDFSAVRTVNLDEYVGLDARNADGYRRYMNDNFFGKINIDLKNTFIPDGTAADLGLECKNYDRLIESLGGIDLQFLGIGQNGHIGFNEPSDCFWAGTHCVDLSQSTREANSRFFGGACDVPRQAVTMGIGTIFAAKKIVLCATGAHKKEILRRAVFGKITPEVPASVLQLHGDVTIIADSDAFGDAAGVTAGDAAGDAAGGLFDFPEGGL